MNMVLEYKEVAAAALYGCFLYGDYAVSSKHQRFSPSRDVANTTSKEQKMILVVAFGRKIITQNFLCCHRPLCWIHPSLSNCLK